jgi:hypothetical protein
MPDAVAEQIAYQQRRVIPARMPRAEHPAVNARAIRARSARPATVTLSRTALAISAPAFPARPAPPGTIPGPPLAHGDTRSTRRPASSRETPAGAARPWPSVESRRLHRPRDRPGRRPPIPRTAAYRPVQLPKPQAEAPPATGYLAADDPASTTGPDSPHTRHAQAPSRRSKPVHLLSTRDARLPCTSPDPAPPGSAVTTPDPPRQMQTHPIGPGQHENDTTQETFSAPP